MTDRSSILTAADRLISKDRADVYGPPRQSFGRIGALWGAMLGMDPFPPETVALMLVQLKVSRIISSPDHEDSWVDLCGYGALGGELATPEQQVEQPIVCSAAALSNADIGSLIKFVGRDDVQYTCTLLGVEQHGTTTVLDLPIQGSETRLQKYIDASATVEVTHG